VCLGSHFQLLSFASSRKSWDVLHTKTKQPQYHTTTAQHQHSNIIMSFHRSSFLVIRSKQMLPADFIPGSFDVICARGAEAHRHNQRFRRTIRMHLPRYASSSDQNDIIERIIDCVRQRSIRGGFILQDPNTGLYFEVGDFHARQKVSQTLKEMMRLDGPARRKLGGRRLSELSFESSLELEEASSCFSADEEEITAPPAMLTYQSSLGSSSSTSFEPIQFRMRKCSQDLMDDDGESCSDIVEQFFNIRRASSSGFMMLDQDELCQQAALLSS
jgi:hypothetical protein